MKRITFKIIRQGFFILLIVSIIPRLIVNTYLELPNRELLLSNEVFFAIVFAVILAIVLSSVGLHYMVVKRIQMIESATHQITHGDLDVFVDMKGSDEISMLADSVNQMTKSLKKNDIQRDMFVRNVSHEMKTPLSLLKGYAELLKEEPLSASGVQYLSIISSEAERLSKLSKNLLDLSLMTSEMNVKKEDDMKLDVFIKDILLRFQLLFEEKALNLDLKLLPIQMKTNQVYLDLILKNVLENALTYTPNGGDVRIHMIDHEEIVSIDITNTGTYLTEEEIKHIHEPFYTGHQKNPQSSGVGLTLVVAALKQLGGFIEITSDHQTYVKAHLKLPY